MGAPHELRYGSFFEAYRVLAPLEVASGEADLWLLEHPARRSKHILKLYRYGVRPKVEILERIARSRSPHLIRVDHHGESRGRVYEIQEHLAFGSLADRLRRGSLDPADVRQGLRQLAEALQELQAFSVLHRDIKPANILFRSLEPLELVVTDFGISSVADLSLHLTNLNRTPAYCAPEATAGVVTKASDWWSVGMLILEMLTGRHPFAGLTEQAINLRLVSHGVEVPTGLPPDWSLLLRGLLTRNYRVRWAGEEVCRWLDGDRTLVPPTDSLDSSLRGARRPYPFEGRGSTTAEALAESLARNWAEAAKHWALGYVLRWVETELQDPRLGSLLREVRDDARLASQHQLSAVLLALHPDLPLAVQGIVLEPAVLESTPELAESIGASSLGDWLMRCRSDPWLQCWSRGYREDAEAVRTWAAVDARSARQWLCRPTAQLLESAGARLRGFVSARDADLAAAFQPGGLTRQRALKVLMAGPHEFLTADEMETERRLRELASFGWWVDLSFGERLIRNPREEVVYPLWRALQNHWYDRKRTALAVEHPGLAAELDSPAPSAMRLIAVLANRLRFTNSLDQVFVPIPGTRTLWSIWQTRVRDFAPFMAAKGWPMKQPPFEQNEDHPAVLITHKLAVEFCEWLTLRERELNRIGPRDRYRLPTDREWSAVVGLGVEPGGSPRERNGAIADLFPWGREWPPPTRAGNLGPSLNVDPFPFTSPVGSFDATSTGLFDLGSNVGEWCSDTYDEDINLNVVRGASWFQTTREGCLSSARRRLSEIEASDTVGFRCVLEFKVPPPASPPVSRSAESAEGGGIVKSTDATKPSLDPALADAGGVKSERKPFWRRL